MVFLPWAGKTPATAWPRPIGSLCRIYPNTTKGISQTNRNDEETKL